MSLFAKIDNGILYSSIWSESPPIRIVWLTLLLLKDQYGFVGTSISGLQRAANVSMDECMDALSKLQLPDTDSRTTDFEGRRIEKVEGGFMIINHEKYNAHSDTIKEQDKERSRKYREKQKGSVTSVTERDASRSRHAPSISISVSKSVSTMSIEDTNTDSDTTNNSNITNTSMQHLNTSPASISDIIPDWRNNFNIYLSITNAALERLLNDNVYLEEQEQFNPGVDIVMSIKKACVNFWRTEAGWKHKKKSRSKDIDMVQTLTNAISMNKVFKPKQSQFGPKTVSDSEIQSFLDEMKGTLQ